jgi:hypothetical protein
MRTPRKGSKDRDRLLRARQDHLRVLAALGIDAAAVRGLPENVRHTIYGLTKTGLRVELAPGAEKFEPAQEALKFLGDQLRTETMDVPGFPGRKISLRDYADTFLALHLAVLGLQRAGTLTRAGAEVLAPVLAVSRHDACDRLFRAIAAKINFVAQVFTRIDTCVCSIGIELEPRSLKIRLIIRFEEPRIRNFTLGGRKRPAYQCAAQCGESPALYWSAWPREMVGLKKGPERLPVYFQSHVFHRLFERLDATHQTLAHLSLLWAMFDPKIDLRGGKIWARCPSPGGDLGYFVGEIVNDCILFRSFLFLTMTGTPQSKKLKRRLRLERRAIELLRLDRLDTFVNSDLSQDPALVRIFNDCDLGHLLALREHLGDDDKAPRRVASQLRLYLGMPAAEAPPAVPAIADAA